MTIEKLQKKFLTRLERRVASSQLDWNPWELLLQSLLVLEELERSLPKKHGMSSEIPFDRLLCFVSPTYAACPMGAASAQVRTRFETTEAAPGTLGVVECLRVILFARHYVRRGDRLADLRALISLKAPARKLGAKKNKIIRELGPLAPAFQQMRWL